MEGVPQDMSCQQLPDPQEGISTSFPPQALSGRGAILASPVSPSHEPEQSLYSMNLRVPEPESLSF